MIRSCEGAEKLYNAQDIGLGKAFAELGHETTVIHFENRSTAISIEQYNSLLTIKHIKTKAIGENSVFISNLLPTKVDLMVCFSDIQISFSEVYRHCVKHKIVLIPYIGVIESHSEHFIKRFAMNCIARLNLSIYKRLHVCSKTDTLKNLLHTHGVNNVTIAPVCLDKDYLNYEMSSNFRVELRKQIIPRYVQDAKCILFVGRLIKEKRPLEALEIFYKLYQQDKDFRLVIIGKGTLKGAVEEFIVENNLSDVVTLQKDIPNKDMWNFYLAADCFINLNHEEIFGMSILEAMFYQCPVVAHKAPGPKMIITNNVDGYIANNTEEMTVQIQKAISTGRLEAAHNTIVNHYLWHQTAKKIMDIVH